MAAVPITGYSVTGVTSFPNIFGGRLYPIIMQRVLLDINLTPVPTQDTLNTPNTHLVKAGTPIGIKTAGGAAAICAPGADGSQILAGILALDYDTSIGQQVAIIYVAGDFDINTIKLQTGDTFALMGARSPKINNSIFIIDTVVAPPSYP